MSKQIESFILPDIGEGIVECEIVKWCVAEGDMLAEDQVVVEVMTDKAVVEIPAKHPGVVTKLHYAQGDIAKVHSPLFEQSIDAENSTDITSGATKTIEQSQVDDEQTPPRAEQASSNSINEKQKALASPAVRRIAREQNIDLNKVTGSGKKGRILKQDLNQTSTASPSQTEQVSQTIALKGIRAAMAKQMKRSVQLIPHFSVSDELCMDQLITLRAQLKSHFAEHDVKLSFMPFFIKALSLALLKFPELNASVSDDEQSLNVHQQHNIGVAVDGVAGLMVPNIKGVEHLSLLDIAQQLQRLIQAAREGRLASSDLSGGTITISNVGAIGGITATPIINHPEVAIVALGKMQTLPRFDEQGAVSASNLLTVNWSGDHRVIDGATMVRFNNYWMSLLENPSSMLMHLR